MKKGILFGVLVIVAVLATIAGAGAYYVGSLQRGNAFLEGTRINGENVSGQTPAQAAAALSADYRQGQVILEEDGREVFRSSLQDLGFALDEKALEESLTKDMESEKTEIGVILSGLVNGNSFNHDIPYTFDEEVFNKAVTKKAVTAPRRENVDAKIIYDEDAGQCRIEPEVRGTQFHDRDLRAWLKDQIPPVFTAGAAEGAWKSGQAQEPVAPEPSAAGGTAASAAAEAGKAGSGTEGKAEAEKAGSGTESQAGTEAAKSGQEGAFADQGPRISLTEEGISLVCTIPSSIYILPDKLSTDENLVRKCDILNRYAGNTITYLFGNESETLDFKTFMNWIKIRGDEVSLRPEKVTEYVSDLAARYETRYRDRVFTTTWGAQITFPATMNDYGYIILEDQEAAQLTQDILSGESVAREPIYQDVNDWGNPVYLSRNGMDDLNGTYVEVSIGAQHMWYYRHGELIVESDVVTGDPTQGMDTATGVFPLAFKESPSTLRGGEGKKKYTTKVQYWMPFYEGQGLHDAWWKTVFGGSEYKGNGSHGCVNLPSSVAETLYNNIEPGTAIIIYN